MMVPSVDVWEREEFLHARYVQMDAQKQIDKRAGRDNVTYIELGRKIVCDSCNCEIDTPTITLVEYGRRCACAACFKKWYASEPINYRRLTVFGTLGEIVKGPIDGQG